MMRSIFSRHVYLLLNLLPNFNSGTEVNYDK